MPEPLRLPVLRAHDGNACGLAARPHQGARRHAAWALLWLALSVCLQFVFAQGAGAQTMELREARIEYHDGGFELDASFDFDLTPPLEDALHKGIPLYFAVDFQLSRPRWYWFDEKPVSTSRSVRLTFHPLTRQYRVSTGGLQLPFTRLKGALDFIRQVRGWRIFDRDDVRLGVPYQAEVRMRLDLSQLPKPFQINAVNTRDWNLSSDWRRFTYTPVETAPPPPVPQPAQPAAPAATAPASPPAAAPASPVAPSVPSNGGASANGAAASAAPTAQPPASTAPPPPPAQPPAPASEGKPAASRRVSATLLAREGTVATPVQP